MRRYTADKVRLTDDGEFTLFIDYFNELEDRDHQIRELSNIIEELKLELETQAEKIIAAAKWTQAPDHNEEPTLKDDTPTDLLIIDSDLPSPPVDGKWIP